MIKQLSEKEGYKINDKDIETILFYIRNYKSEIIKNPISFINKKKEEIDNDTYLFLINLCKKYKKEWN